MPSNVVSNVENNFTKGLVTEFTGFNFPENAATDTDNCTYTLVGDVTRRQGIDYEDNFVFTTLDKASSAITTFKWDNAGGDGLTQMVVEQVGATLYFYLSSSATVDFPLSFQRFISTVTLNGFAAFGGPFDGSAECQYASGNGYLIVYHPSCDPFFCTFNSDTSTITAVKIDIKVRDFTGIAEPTLNINTRPGTLSNEHLYNLTNQGWIKGSPWRQISITSITAGNGLHTFTIATGVSVTVGDQVNIANAHQANIGGIFYDVGVIVMSGTVTGYTTGTGALIVNVTSTFGPWIGYTDNGWTIAPFNTGYIDTWFATAGVYPSNSDVWWYYKNASGAFDPATTLSNKTWNAGDAPKGRFLLNPFIQDRSLISGVTSITPVTTTVRPRTGCWFQGRVWYTGVDAQQQATGDVSYYTWTENIYFSKVIESTNDFGKCYQTNDPTSDTLFDLLPTDGGVIKIPGCGSIYKLFPIQNALLVFAANGVWYITGSQGIGFTANDYTLVQLSAVHSISSTSFVDINGLPMFWNEEGIYSVEPAKQGGGLQGNPLHVNPLEVNAITVGTILTFYNSIPLKSKKYARGAYDPIEYKVQWIYKSTDDVSVIDRYTFDRVLNFNVVNKAFFPYSLTLDPANPGINGITYVSSFGGAAAIDSGIKYNVSKLISGSIYNFTFAEEFDTDYVDWASAGTPVDYDSFFITGYKLHGQGQHRFQIPYIYMYSKSEDLSAYKIQGLWDYAITGDSGRWSVAQLINSWTPNYAVKARRIKIRGRGLVLQLKVSSKTGCPFDIIGWSAYENVNTGV